MWKMMFKNLWSRRRRMGWLLAEMVIVTIVIWVLVDPIIVDGYVDRIPLGYDRDRLCVIESRKINSMSPGYDPERSDVDDMRNLLKSIENIPGVEGATIADWSYPDAMGMSTTGVLKDNVWIQLQSMPMVCGWNYLTTFGIEAAQGSPDAEQLQNMTPNSKDIIITRTVADLFFPGINPVGHYLRENEEDFNPDDSYRIAGVIEDIRPRSTNSTSLMFFQLYEFYPENDYKVIVRMEKGADKNRFVKEFNENMKGRLGAGNYRCQGAESYDEVSEDFAYIQGVTSKNRLNKALTLFFFANLLLGVAGVFYLQTRKRSEDAGVMRSFGATPRNIRLMLLGEGWILTTAGWLVGCVIYLQYAIREGLARSHDNVRYDAYDPGWIADFTLHFLIVSLIVWVLMMVVVTIGVYIPAWRISRVNPVDALRHD